MGDRRPRTLWKVYAGATVGNRHIQLDVWRPESKVKAYGIYVENNRHTYDWSEVWVDERDGVGWRLYERIEHPRGS